MPRGPSISTKFQGTFAVQTGKATPAGERKSFLLAT